MEHYSVLKEECLSLLQIKAEGIYVDGTLGRAGHAAAILEKLVTGWLFGFDKDWEAILASNTILQRVGSNFTLFHCDFSQMQEKLKQEGFTSVDGILLDLGVSSPQFDQAERGFSYNQDAKLDMRYDQNQELSAYQVVNEYSQEELTRILWDYGEEKFARQIAKSIVSKRPLQTTLQLVSAIKEGIPQKVLKQKGHPAKQSFQALRAEVNNEAQSLSSGLQQALELLKPGGRLAVISFQSLDDRIIKTKFREVTSVSVDKKLPLKAAELPLAKFVLVNRKVITATAAELTINQRSHSAKLRVIERVEV